MIIMKVVLGCGALVSAVLGLFVWTYPLSKIKGLFRASPFFLLAGYAIWYIISKK